MTEHESEPAEADESASGLLRYEPNPKHKNPWQRGARGSLCPPGADGDALLAVSEPDPGHAGKRFAAFRPSFALRGSPTSKSPSGI
jgi:hypothetical protein